MAESWVELRVHGVSGTPAESMLDVSRVDQVAGDEFGRFFRPHDQPEAVEGRLLEAYHWGRFTSGSWSQALWLLLAPFGIVNAAQFTLEPPTSGAARAAHAVAGAMLRLIGLALTALLVLSVAVITVDLWAWQKVGVEPTPLRWAVAIGMLGPLAVVALLLFFGRARLTGADDPGRGNPYVLSPGTTEPEGEAESDGGGDRSIWSSSPPTELARRGFFDGDADAPALRWLHAAAALALVAVLGFAPNREVHEWSRWGLVGSIVLAGLVALLVLVLGDPEGSVSGQLTSARLDGWRHWLHMTGGPWTARFAALAAGGLTALSIISLMVSPPVPETVLPERVTIDHYPGIDHSAGTIMFVAGIAMLVLVVANFALRTAERTSAAKEIRGWAGTPAQFRPYAGGWAPTLLTSLGLFLGVGFAGAFGVAAAKALGSVEAPEQLQRVVYAWGVTAVVIAGLALVGVGRWLLARKALRRQVKIEFGNAGSVLPTRWVRRIATGIWAARLKNSLVSILTTFFVTGMVLTFATAIERPTVWRGGASNDNAGVLSGASCDVLCENDSWAAGPLMWLGGVTLTGLAALLLFVGRTAIAAESTRRSVNVLWDVIAFWPRVAHPLVPPAYSLRSVADIRRRVAWHLGALSPGPAPEPPPPPVDRVVLCAHSQGSLLCFAAVVSMRMSPTELNRLSLLTFGSQLQVMFSRAFPAYVNFQTISWMYDLLGTRWRSLYRDTDYLAGPVLSWAHIPAAPGEPPTAQHLPDPADPAAVDPPGLCRFGPDWRLLDPPPPDTLLQLHPLETLRRHSDYWHDPAWATATAALRSQ